MAAAGKPERRNVDMSSFASEFPRNDPAFTLSYRESTISNWALRFSNSEFTKSNWGFRFCNWEAAKDNSAVAFPSTKLAGSDPNPPESDRLDRGRNGFQRAPFRIDSKPGFCERAAYH